MPELHPRATPGSSVDEVSSGGWRLSIPDGPAGTYRWSQLDDYLNLQRKDFYWRAPVTLSLWARISSQFHTGTWGFGFWNDPFNFSTGIGGTMRRLPALPNTAWFFFASAPNSLTLRDHLPANGMLAASFSSIPIPSWMLAPGVLALPLLAFRSTSFIFRKLLRVLVHEDSRQLLQDWTGWHKFAIHWQPQRMDFLLDGQVCFQTSVVPHAPLGLVLWIDNQYARLANYERFRTGTLPTTQESCLEIKDLSIS